MKSNVSNMKSNKDKAGNIYLFDYYSIQLLAR